MSSVGDFFLGYRTSLRKRGLARQPGRGADSRTSQEPVTPRESPAGAGFDAFCDAPVPMWFYEAETLRIRDVNQAALQIYGYSRDKFLTLSVNDIQSVDTSGNTLHRLRNGTRISVSVHEQSFMDAGCQMVFAVIHDVTSQLETERHLILQTTYFRQLFENSPDGIAFLNKDRLVMDVNPAFERLFDYKVDELRGRCLKDIIAPPGMQEESLQVFDHCMSKSLVHVETSRQRRNGDILQVSILGYPITIDGEQIGVYAIYRDITERKRVVEEIAHQATHDELTDLVNRREFERCATALVNRAAAADKGNALLYIDLDQFKVVNDSCGHSAGDRLLKDIGRLLRESVRTTDTIARLGGDEFAILLQNCPPAVAERIAQRIVHQVADYHFHWNDKSFHVGASIGLVIVDDSIRDFSSLMTAADTACYTAKEKGRHRVQLYRSDDAEMIKQQDQLDWVSRINHALDNDRFVLYYQRLFPINPDQGLRPHYEILVRMLDSQQQLVPPNAFIPAAERFGLMPAIDRWVIRHVFQTLAQRTQSRRNDREVVGINISGTSLSENGFADWVRDQFESHQVNAGAICFEITETAAISDMERALEFIHAMHGLGCAIALDDFGSGMSSFNYLKQLGADYLKIDGAFIKDMADNDVDSAMAEAINRVGQVMGIRTVAEYVENDRILARLRKLGVDYAQGFGVHRPEPWR
jgi:diguanylate cyclase (GGDEF)-like protein/PAS domain S-box-containing protein